MNKHLSECIRTNRLKLKLSQNQLAEKLNISYQAISKWEKGTAYPSLDILPELSKLFNISIDKLLTGREFKKDINIVSNDVVDYFGTLIHPWAIGEYESRIITKLVKKYGSGKVKDALDLSFQKYLIPKNNRYTRLDLRDAVQKTIGILYNDELDPFEKELKRIMYTLKNKFDSRVDPAEMNKLHKKLKLYVSLAENVYPTLSKNELLDLIKDKLINVTTDIYMANFLVNKEISNIKLECQTRKRIKAGYITPSYPCPDFLETYVMAFNENARCGNYKFCVNILYEYLSEFFKHVFMKIDSDIKYSNIPELKSYYKSIKLYLGSLVNKNILIEISSFMRNLYLKDHLNVKLFDIDCYLNLVDWSLKKLNYAKFSRKERFDIALFDKHFHIY